MSRGPLFPPRGVDPRAFSPTESHPLVDDFSLRAARMHARQQPAGVSQVYPVPLRNHPLWSGNNELGRQAEFAPDANNTQTILKLEEWGPPEFWTVCLGLYYDLEAYAAESVTRLFDVTALITFGAGGTTQEVEVDWLNGSAITLPMNAVNVRASYSFPSFGESGDVGRAPADLKLRASLCKGAVTGARPTRTYYFDADNPLTGLLVIPPFAKSVFIAPVGRASLHPSAFYAQNGVVQFHADPTATGGAIITEYELSQLVTSFDVINQVVGAPVALPVPAFARALTLSAVSGTLTNQACTVQFLLGL